MTTNSLLPFFIFFNLPAVKGPVPPGASRTDTSFSSPKGPAREQRGNPHRAGPPAPPGLRLSLHPLPGSRFARRNGAAAHAGSLAPSLTCRRSGWPTVSCGWTASSWRRPFPRPPAGHPLLRRRHQSAAPASTSSLRLPPAPPTPEPTTASGPALTTRRTAGAPGGAGRPGTRMSALRSSGAAPLPAAFSGARGAAASGEAAGPGSVSGDHPSRSWQLRGPTPPRTPPALPLGVSQDYCSRPPVRHRRRFLGGAVEPAFFHWVLWEWMRLWANRRVPAGRAAEASQ